MKDFDYEDLAFETAHEECGYCTELLILAFNAFKLSAAEYASTGIANHYGAAMIASSQN